MCRASQVLGGATQLVDPSDADPWLLPYVYGCIRPGLCSVHGYMLGSIYLWTSVRGTPGEPVSAQKDLFTATYSYTGELRTATYGLGSSFFFHNGHFGLEGASNGRSAELDVPAIDNSGHCSEQVRIAPGFLLGDCPGASALGLVPSFLMYSRPLPLCTLWRGGGGGGRCPPSSYSVRPFSHFPGLALPSPHQGF